MDFKKGKLYVRCVDGIVESLFVPLQDTAEPYERMPAKEIIWRFFDEPFVWDSVEFVEETFHDGQKVPFTGLTFSFREATDEDLDSILRDVRARGEKENVSLWAISVIGIPELDPVERDRILSFLQ